jgi:hypothetical protein
MGTSVEDQVRVLATHALRRAEQIDGSSVREPNLGDPSVRIEQHAAGPPELNSHYPVHVSARHSGRVRRLALVAAAIVAVAIVGALVARGPDRTAPITDAPPSVDPGLERAMRSRASTAADIAGLDPISVTATATTAGMVVDLFGSSSACPAATDIVVYQVQFDGEFADNTTRGGPGVAPGSGRSVLLVQRTPIDSESDSCGFVRVPPTPVDLTAFGPTTTLGLVDPAARLARHPVVGTSTEELAFGMVWIGDTGDTFGGAPEMPAGSAPPSLQMPTYLGVSSRDGLTLAGFVLSEELDRSHMTAIVGGDSTLTVYDADGRTQVGTFVQGKGFIALDEDPASVPTASRTTLITSESSPQSMP